MLSVCRRLCGAAAAAATSNKVSTICIHVLLKASRCACRHRRRPTVSLLAWSKDHASAGITATITTATNSAAATAVHNTTATASRSTTTSATTAATPCNAATSNDKVSTVGTRVALKTSRGACRHRRGATGSLLCWGKDPTSSGANAANSTTATTSNSATITATPSTTTATNTTASNDKLSMVGIFVLLKARRDACRHRSGGACLRAGCILTESEVWGTCRGGNSVAVSTTTGGVENRSGESEAQNCCHRP
mmetsp:Transcript_111821/g.281423  ORF Transcript_111821/g.281423 Transcript_111821/m.281423 type:complete len:251 (-) Transcript_111821:291-1043(-)